jgi:hypothetical protein
MTGGQIPTMAFVAAILALWVLFPALRGARAHQLLGRWARSERFRIVERRRRIFDTGPFTWIWLGHAMVYWVVLEDAERRQRTAWVKCGTFFGGLLSSNVEVAWDDTNRMTGNGVTRRDRYV